MGEEAIGENQDPIAVVLAIYDALAERDVERMMALTHEDFAFETDNAEISGNDAYYGREGLQQFFEDISRLTSFVTKPVDYVMHEGRVAVLSTTSARSPDGTEQNILGVSLWEVVDGRVRSIDGPTDPDRVTELLLEIPFRRPAG